MKAKSHSSVIEALPNNDHKHCHYLFCVQTWPRVSIKGDHKTYSGCQYIQGHHISTSLNII